MGRTDVKITADQYRSLPDTARRHELIDGELVAMPPAPSRRHQDLVWELGSRLRTFVRTAALGYVGGSPLDLYLSEHDVVQPDLLFVSHARMDRLADDGVHGGPDLVVEVLSPRTRQVDLGAKRRLYALHGVREYWVVDPQEETISRFDLDTSETPVAFGPGACVSSRVVPGFSVDVSDLFLSA